MTAHESFRIIWNLPDLPETSGTFRKLPEPSGTFWNLPEPFPDIPGPSGTISGPSETIRDTPKVIRINLDTSGTIPELSL
jgi:hypothetical protein